MEHKIIKKNDSVVLVLTSNQLIDAFELGELKRDLEGANISHSISYAPPEIKVSLTGKDIV